MKTLTVKITKDMDARLTALAHEQGESKSALVRMAIKYMVESRGETDVSSALNQIDDLVGCVDGHKDLSYNKGYMKGYGR